MRFYLPKPFNVYRYRNNKAESIDVGFFSMIYNSFVLRWFYKEMKIRIY